MTSLMRLEALEAPEAVSRCLARSDFAALGKRLQSLDPPFILLSARGSSGHVGTVLRYVLAQELGLVAAAGMPSVASVYGVNQKLAGALFLAVSQSGKSPDLVAQAQSVRAGGAFTLAIVNDAASPLAAACEAVLDIHAGPERSVAATKTVLSSLAAGLALIEAWSGRYRPGLARLPERLRESVGLDWSELERLLVQVRNLFIVGRGPGLGIAEEAGLKLAETCRLPALAFSTAELAHGPQVLADAAFPIVALLAHDPALTTARAVLEPLAARAPLLSTVDVPGATRLPQLPPDDPVCDLASLLLRFYLAAEVAAGSLGRDPDHPPGLAKITHTV
ncbi:MAG: SIS domain-containing protein [Rhodospirillales bacterium]|nr:SIS domain-containing protein [Rhodospirillales bacterium]